MAEPTRSEAPRSEGQAGVGFEDPATLARLDEVERRVDNNKKNLAIVQNTNWLIILVLFVAILAISFAAIFQFIGAITANKDSTQQLTQSVNDLKVQVQVLQKTQNTTTSVQTTTP
jgi:cytoskeletal protein RodZ